MATTRKKKIEVPTVVKGSHLTVTTRVDGTTVLEWDNEALLREVQEAIASVEGEKNVKTRKTRKSK